MTIDRRQFLAVSAGACLGSCGTPSGDSSGAAVPRVAGSDAVERVFAANVGVLPEAPGAGANHYPMAAEALEALGRGDAVPATWSTSLRGYAGAAGRVAPIATVDDALGDYDRLGDWHDLFVAELERSPWRDVVARWAPRLAPGFCGGMFHGVIRVGHAVRALLRRETAARRAELALALAYWAARYRALPASGAIRRPGVEFRDAFTDLDVSAASAADADVTFFSSFDRPVELRLAPVVAMDGHDRSPRADLVALVRAAAEVFLELFVVERHRILHLHAVTGPAAVEMLLPVVDDAGARVLVEYAWQADAALFRAHGAAVTPGAHRRERPADWAELVARAAASGSVHSIKLIEALRRFDDPQDTLCRSVAEAWLEWT